MKVLVATASRHGATKGIGDEIASRLSSHAMIADSLPVEEVSDLSGYDAIVLGSAVYAGRWLEHARHFIDHHAAELAARPTWIFSSGPLGQPPEPDEANAVNAEPILERTGAREHRVFTGKLDMHELGFGERTVSRVVHAKEGDFRDWTAIHEWADSIATALEATVLPDLR
jgi:menaquinone-dependent protoporphyrinogen oxidase